MNNVFNVIVVQKNIQKFKIKRIRAIFDFLADPYSVASKHFSLEKWAVYK